jgi:hypothetical protein
MPFGILMGNGAYTHMANDTAMLGRTKTTVQDFMCEGFYLLGEMLNMRLDSSA